MALQNRRSRRKPSGGRLRALQTNRKHSRAGIPTLTKLGKESRKTVRVIGGNEKTRVLHSETVNLVDKKSKTQSKVKILKIVENPANRHFVRRNIITKGTVIETEKGKAVVTSKPGQHGMINAVLI